MDPSRPAVDLGRELTCSICTELLYQPLTLLDCLHTFDGACLKEWFSWQAAAAESAPSPPAPDATVFTCPSCRAPVRDTRHNATVVTLLDMYLAANPDKAKPAAEKEEMDGKYRPGDRVLPQLKITEKSAAERRMDEEDRQILEEVREMSLREAVGGRGTPPRATSRTRRPRGESQARDDRGEGRSPRPSRDPSRESSQDSGRPGTSARDARHRARRQAVEQEVRRRAETSAVTGSASENSGEEGRIRRSDHAQRITRAHAERSRGIEHQSSIRSLISRSSNSALDSRDMAREIEEFTRQIQEEGLLDGVDLDNIDLHNNDELSRKITEAYRRRHRERLRQEAHRRRTSNVSAHSQRSSESALDPRPRTRDSSRPASRQRASSGPRTPEERGRYPPSSSHHLEVQEPRQRRRTTSGERSATVPIATTEPETRPASRSQTDLGLGTRSSEHSPNRSWTRPTVAPQNRSASTPTVVPASQTLSESPRLRGLPFSARISSNGLGSPESPGVDSSSDTSRRPPRPSNLIISPAVSANFASPPSVASPRARPVMYPEPNITCRRCKREHIEYELHYHCAVCDEGQYDICLSCYRQGRGCLHWFGFGRLAWVKWERARNSGGQNVHLPEPHQLNATRYLAPKGSPGAAEGRRAVTAENPLDRLQSGAFCSRCQAWANECYWRCDFCNDGDWGFCNDCFNQGRCCTHPLLPLTFQLRPLSSSGSPPRSPRYRGSPQSPRPPTATILTGPHAIPSGPFMPLMFNIRCDLCRLPIPPVQNRHHCYACVSPTLGADTKPGDCNYCEACYAGLLRDGSIAPENGIEGWRRCLQGHRMVVLRFVEGNGGQRRILAHDWVGGRMLRVETLSPGTHTPRLQLWSWKEGPQKSMPRRERLVTVDVGSSADPSAVDAAVQARLTRDFPPEGGCLPTMRARFGWYPAAGPAHADELLFPRGADIGEIDQFDDEWYHGTYMGEKGVFPAPYVWALQ